MDHIAAVCAMAIMCATESSVSNNNEYTIDYSHTTVNTQIINMPEQVYKQTIIESIRQDVYKEIYQEIDPLAEELAEKIRQDVSRKLGNK